MMAFSWQIDNNIEYMLAEFEYKAKHGETQIYNFC